MLNKLMEYMRAVTGQDTCVAFSGGVDSSILLKTAALAAKENGTRVYAVTFSTRLQPAGDLQNAKNVAQECEVEHFVLHLDEQENEKILNNSKERCYWCKRFLFGELFKWGQAHGSSVVLEGSNADDLKVYRPGLRAVKELGAKSPLAELGITKSEVRRMANELGLSVAKRPSAPCMATRIPYDTALDFTVLKKLEEGELKLKEMGFEVVRLRLHGEIVRIEVAPEQLAAAVDRREKIINILKKLGFTYFCLDLEGFRSGSMDVG